LRLRLICKYFHQFECGSLLLAHLNRFEHEAQARDVLAEPSVFYAVGHRYRVQDVCYVVIKEVLHFLAAFEQRDGIGRHLLQNYLCPAEVVNLLIFSFNFRERVFASGKSPMEPSYLVQVFSNEVIFAVQPFDPFGELGFDQILITVRILSFLRLGALEKVEIGCDQMVAFWCNLRVH
jgi:hypothetical protein